jgi:hypothetical protein
VADGFVTAGTVIAALGFAANLLIVALTPLDTGDGSAVSLLPSSPCR